MRLVLDKSSDQLYIYLSENKSVESQEISPGLVADFDENKQLCGFDIENASRFDLSKISIELLNEKTV